MSFPWEDFEDSDVAVEEFTELTVETPPWEDFPAVEEEPIPPTFETPSVITEAGPLWEPSAPRPTDFKTMLATPSPSLIAPPEEWAQQQADKSYFDQMAPGTPWSEVQARVEEETKAPQLKLGPDLAPVSQMPVSPGERITQQLAMPEIANTLGPDITAQITREAWNLTKALPEFFGSIEGLESVAAGTVAPAAVTAYFGYSMLKSLADQAKEAGKEWDQMPLTDKVKAVVDMVGTGIMTGTLTGHLGKTVKSKVEARLAKAGPSLEVPAVTGAGLELPKGAPAPRLEAPTIERATPEQAAAQLREAQFTGAVEPPGTPRAEVPATAPEAERGENVLAEIRRRNLTTKEAIRAAFPKADLTREEAAALRRMAWGEKPAEPSLEAPPPEEPHLPAVQATEAVPRLKPISASLPSPHLPAVQATEAVPRLKPISASLPSPHLPAVQATEAVEKGAGITLETAPTIELSADAEAALKKILGELGDEPPAETGTPVKPTPPTKPTAPAGAAAKPEDMKSTEDAHRVGLSISSIDKLESLAAIGRQRYAQSNELIQNAKAETNPEKKIELLAQSQDLRAQLFREAVEVATNTGSSVEGEGTSPASKLGKRPLDWRNNPEVAEWLRNKAKDLGIKLPDELQPKSTPKPPEPTPTESKAKEPWEMELDDFIAQEMGKRRKAEHGGTKFGQQFERSEPKKITSEWLAANEKAYIEGKPVIEKPTWAITAEQSAKRSGDDVESIRDWHKGRVQEALSAGKPVPPEVLADYRDLKPPPTAPAGEKAAGTPASVESLVRDLHENDSPTQADLDSVTSKLSDAEKKKYAGVLSIAARKIEKAAGVDALNKRMAEPGQPVDLQHPTWESITTAMPDDLFPDLKGKAPTLERVRRAITEEEANYEKLYQQATLPDTESTDPVHELADKSEKRINRLRALGQKLESQEVTQAKASEPPKPLSEFELSSLGRLELKRTQGRRMTVGERTQLRALKDRQEATKPTEPAPESGMGPGTPSGAVGIRPGPLMPSGTPRYEDVTHQGLTWRRSSGGRWTDPNSGAPVSSYMGKKLEDAYQRRKSGMGPGESPGAEPMPPGPGAASPAEFAQRQAGANRVPPPQNPPVALEPGQMPTPEIMRQNRDYNIFNRINSPQWLFYFGKLGQAAKAAWETMVLGEFRMRESARRDIQQFVIEPLRSLPRELRRNGGKSFFDALNGKKMDDIQSEWEGKPGGDLVITQAEKIKTRLEEIRTTIRDIKRDSWSRYLNGLSKDSLSDLFRRNISETQDISGMTKEDIAHALTMDQFPDDWGIADGSYLPHLFFGQWKVTVRMAGAEGTDFITRSQTIQEAKARVYERVKADPSLRDAQFTIEQDTVVPADMIRLGDRRFWHLVNEMKQHNIEPEAIRDAFRGNIGRKSTKEKWFGSLQQRKGYAGYSRDFGRVMSSYLNGFHRWSVLTEVNRKAQPLIEQTRREGRINAAQRLEDILDNLWGKPSSSTKEFDAFVRNIPVVRDYVKPLALDRWVRAATHLTGLLTLRTLRFSVVNRLQPLQGLYPLIGERGLIEAKILQHTRRGRDLLTEAGVDLDPGQYASETAGRTTARAMMERFSGERSNQELSFLAMYQHARKLGISHGEAITYGKLRGQLLTQFTPLIADTPALFEGPFGKVMFQFKRFPVKQVELMSQMVSDKNVPAIARLVGAFATLGGISFFLRQTWATDPDNRLRIKRSLDKSLGTKAGDALMYGLPGYLGTDISGSITLGDEPIGRGPYEKAARFVSGPAVSLGIETAKTLTAPSRQKTTIMQDAETLLRRFPTTKPLAELSALLRGDLDLRTPDGEIKLRRKLTDAIAGLGSFRSANEANISLAVNGLMELAKKEAALKNDWYVATDKSKASQAIAAFNQAWPEASITQSDLDSYSQYRKTAAQRKTDVTRIAGKRYEKLIPQEQRK